MLVPANERPFWLPIADGFALVRVGRVESVPVLLWNRRNGTTSHKGELLVSDLNSNAVNRITLDYQNLPINWSLARSERSVRVPYRGGVLVDFEPKMLQSFEGRAFFVRDGTAKPAELAGIEIDLDGNTVQSVVGKDGQFYFENLPEGSYSGRLFLDSQEGRFTLHIPHSDEMTVDLGDIRCEAGK